MVTQTQHVSDRQIQMDPRTLRMKRQTLRELDLQISSQAFLDSGRGCRVRLPSDPGSRRGLHTVTNEAPST